MLRSTLSRILWTPKSTSDPRARDYYQTGCGSTHSSSSMDPKANGYNCALYKHMREVGPFEFSLELLEAYPCNTKKEMVQREQFWMDQYDWEILLNQRRAIKK